jgi:hypothetical protein
MKVNGKDYPIYEMENKKCSKPPISLYNADFTKSPLLQLAMENQLRNGGKRADRQ